jgi:hypothetical protein
MSLHLDKLDDTYIIERLGAGVCALCQITARVQTWNYPRTIIHAVYADEPRTWLGCRSLCFPLRNTINHDDLSPQRAQPSRYCEYKFIVDPR